MRRFRSLAAAPALMFAASALHASTARAQAAGRLIDEGTLLITKTGGPPATENFKILRLDGGILLATGQRTSGGERMTSALRTDSLGTPLEYTLNVNDGRRSVLRVSALAHAGRLSSQSTDERGDESMHEYPVTTGRCLILESELLHQTYFAALVPHRTGIEVITPRSSRGVRLPLQAHGLEPIEVAGRSVTGTHYTLGSGPTQREFWVDAAGRLLLVEVPSQGLKATREELPR